MLLGFLLLMVLVALSRHMPRLFSSRQDVSGAQRSITEEIPGMGWWSEVLVHLWAQCSSDALNLSWGPRGSGLVLMALCAPIFNFFLKKQRPWVHWKTPGTKSSVFWLVFGLYWKNKLCYVFHIDFPSSWCNVSNLNGSRLETRYREKMFWSTPLGKEPGFLILCPCYPIKFCHWPVISCPVQYCFHRRANYGIR